MEVLKRADDEELRYYLLPLVQALRYEPSDDSRLARFLVSRATRDIALGVPLHWCVSPRNLACSTMKRKPPQQRTPALVRLTTQSDTFDDARDIQNKGYPKQKRSVKVLHNGDADHGCQSANQRQI